MNSKNFWDKFPVESNVDKNLIKKSLQIHRQHLELVTLLVLNVYCSPPSKLHILMLIVTL